MKHLLKIKISNARRFGEDVEINLSKGVNIILAPNGTGKTTFFEAIEFALTGSVRRLDSPPLSFIRDSEDGVKIRLEFEDDKYCEVLYEKGKTPVLSGDQQWVYPNYSSEDVPYLLRLTHLLEQRGNEWFIQQEETEQAGALLDRLGLGKQLPGILKNKASTLNAATRTIGERAAAYSAHTDRVADFRTKLTEREAAKVDFVLVPLAELLRRATTVYRSISRQPTIITDEKLDVILAYIGQVQSAHENAANGLRQQLHKIAEFENKVAIFQINKKTIEEISASIASRTQTRNEKKDDLERLKGEVKKQRDLRDELGKSIAILQTLKGVFAEKRATQVKIEENTRLLASYRLAEPEALKKQMDVTAQLERLNALVVKFNLMRQEEAGLLKRRGELQSMAITLEEWKKNEDSIEVENKHLSTVLIPRQAELQAALQRLQGELAVLEKTLGENEGRLQSLRSASEAILGAVGIISANIPSTQRDCPVCSASYEADELRRRIDEAMKGIDPVLRDQIETNRTNKQSVDQKSSEIKTIDVLIRAAKKDIADHETSLRAAEAFINEKCLPLFAGCRSVAEASDWLVREQKKNEDNITRVWDERSGSGVEPAREEIASIEAEKAKATRAVTELNESLVRLRGTLEMLNSELERIARVVLDREEIGVDSKLHELNTSFATTVEDITHGDREVEDLSGLVNSLDSEVLNDNAALSQLTGQQNGILADWQSINPEGEELSMEAYTKRKDDISGFEQVLRDATTELSRLNEELGRWRVSEKYQSFDLEIKNLCGSLSEEAYLRQLTKKSEELQRAVDTASQKKAALTALYLCLNNEVDSVHEQIKAINPAWVTLLKRVVLNPRFVDTTLNSYAYRNKSHATVSVNMHATEVSVMQVASEAQATDLQLTFMLAMASKYKWTPWKALLLDDPTQHHDLVHSAGVFDLLRDYVVDQHFQVIMATHDTVQARFFERKLKNDGIDVKVWDLVADVGGVKASLV